MKDVQLRKVILAIKLQQEVQQTTLGEPAVTFGTGFRVPINLWRGMVNKIQKDDVSKSIDLKLCRVSVYQGKVELTVGTDTEIELREKDPAWAIAEEDKFPFVTSNATVEVKQAYLVPWNEALEAPAPCTVSLRAILSIGEVNKYNACPDAECTKAVLKAARGEYLYYCPSCNVGRNSTKECMHGWVSVENPDDKNGSAPIVAKAFDKQLKMLTSYEATHIGAPVVFNVKIKKDLVKSDVVVTLQEISSS